MGQDQPRSRVTFITSHYRVMGYVELLPGARLTDFMLESGPFIAVVDAEITDPAGSLMRREPFLDISRAHIQMVIPGH
jgi:hypothetical protein